MTELTKKGTTEIANVSLFEEDAGQGLENIRQEDLPTPYLVLLQKGSPQVDPDSSEYITGATSGMFLNSVTNDIFTSINIIPAFFERIFVEWVDRDNGGGLVGYHSPDSPIVKKAIEKNDDSLYGDLITDTGNMLQESFRFYAVCMNIEDGNVFPAIISFSSTQIKVAKKMLSRMKTATLRNKAGANYVPPMYAGIWKCVSVPQQNDKYTWRGWKVEFANYINEENKFEVDAYLLAKEFNKFAKSGNVKIAEEPKSVNQKESEF